jgi:hypothetical protein
MPWGRRPGWICRPSIKVILKAIQATLGSPMYKNRVKLLGWSWKSDPKDPLPSSLKADGTLKTGSHAVFPLCRWERWWSWEAAGWPLHIQHSLSFWQIYMHLQCARQCSGHWATAWNKSEYFTEEGQGRAWKRWCLNREGGKKILGKEGSGPRKV